MELQPCSCRKQLACRRSVPCFCAENEGGGEATHVENPMCWWAERPVTAGRDTSRNMSRAAALTLQPARSGTRTRVSVASAQRAEPCSLRCDNANARDSARRRALARPHRPRATLGLGTALAAAEGANESSGRRRSRIPRTKLVWVAELRSPEAPVHGARDALPREPHGSPLSIREAHRVPRTPEPQENKRQRDDVHRNRRGPERLTQLDSDERGNGGRWCSQLGSDRVHGSPGPTWTTIRRCPSFAAGELRATWAPRYRLALAPTRGGESARCIA
jgi:hypothetical protein